MRTSIVKSELPKSKITRQNVALLDRIEKNQDTTLADAAGIPCFLSTRGTPFSHKFTILENQIESRLESLVSWWIGRVLKAPWLVVILTAALTGVSLTYAIDNLGINTDTNDLLSSNLPFRKTYEQYKREFPQFVDTMLFIVEGPTPEITHSVAAELTGKLKQATRSFNSVYTPDAEPFFEKNGLLYKSVDELETLSDRLATIQPFLATLTQDQSLGGLLDILGKALKASASGEQIDLIPILTRLDQAIQAELSSTPYSLSWQEMMLGESEDRAETNRRYVVVQPRLKYSDWLPSERAMRTARKIIASFSGEEFESVHIRLTGGVALEYEELQSVSKGAGSAAIIAVVMVLILLLVGLRSTWLVMAVLASLFVGLSLTAGFATLAVGELNMISVAFAVLYIGLGVDFAIHFSLRYRQFVRTGAGKFESLRQTGSYVGTSLLVCAMTTAIGFYAFIPTAYSGVSELGLISGTGMFISLLVSLTFLPALLSLKTMSTTKTSEHLVEMPRAITEAPYNHAVGIRRSAIVAGLVGIILLPLADFDYNPLNLRDPNSESVSAFRELLATSATPPWNVTILAENRDEAERMSQRLRKLDVVGKVVTLENFVPDDQEEKLLLIEDMSLLLGLSSNLSANKSNAEGETPLQRENELIQFRDQLMTYLETQKPAKTHEIAVQLFLDLDTLLYRLKVGNDDYRTQTLSELETSLVGTLPESLQRLERALTASPFDITELPEEVTNRWMAEGGAQRIQVFPSQDLNDNDALKAFVEQVTQIAPNATDFPVITLESGQAVVKAFQQAFVGAFLVITLLLLIIIRNPTDVIYLMIPLLLAGLLTAATAIAVGIEFNFANIIALPLLLGIGVDNGIHMIWRARHAVSARRNLLRTSTARAVIVSALTTVVSFGNLSFSVHPGTASMGKLLTIGVIFTLVTTLIVLPALLSIRHDNNGEGGVTA